MDSRRQFYNKYLLCYDKYLEELTNNNQCYNKYLEKLTNDNQCYKKYLENMTNNNENKFSDLQVIWSWTDNAIMLKRQRNLWPQRQVKKSNFLESDGQNMFEV